MGKISKYSNLYDKNGEFLHGPGKWTTAEMEQLLETLPKYSAEWTNVTRILMQTKEDFSFDDKTIQKLLERNNTTKEEVIGALNEVKDEGIAHESRVQGSDAEAV